MWPLALALAVMHVATAIVSEPDVDVLDAGLMEAALKNYRRHQLEGSLDSHADLLTSLLEVTENVSNALGEEQGTPQDFGWKFGASREGDFAFTLDGEAKAFINRNGEVWGAKAAGYLMRRSQQDAPEGSSALQDSPDTKIESGKWSAGVTTGGDLGFFNSAGDVVAVITSDGKMWGASEAGYFAPNNKVEMSADYVAPSVTRNNKRNSEVSLGDWTIGEDAHSGAIVFSQGTDLKAYIDRDGNIFAVGEGSQPLQIKGHATRDPGAITSAVDTQEKDCTVSQWSVFSTCTLPCGGGKQTRTREVTSQRRNGGAICPVLKETRPCLSSHRDLERCPNDCLVSSWSAWGECSKQCGGGTQLRHRNVTQNPSSRGRPCPAISESKHCNVELCGVQLCSQLSGSFALDAKKPSELVVLAKDKWVVYNTDDSKIIQGPNKLSDDNTWFASLPMPFSNHIDATFSAKNGETVYMISHGHDDEGVKRTQWLLYDNVDNRIERGPYGMDLGPFSTLGAPFNHTIDAALNVEDQNQAYFFSGNQWVLYDMESATVAEGPHEINSGPSLNLPAPFNSKIDAAHSQSAGRTILFSGDQWLQWDTATRTVIDGPFVINVHPQFSPLVSALDLCTGFDLRRLGDLEQKLANVKPEPVGSTNVIAGSIIAGYVDSKYSEDARFDKPQGITKLGDDIYTVDSGNNAVRKMNVLTGEISTVAGGHSSPGFQDGTGNEARFNTPVGISGVRISDSNFPGDLLYVADSLNHAIRRIWIPQGDETGIVSTAAGGGVSQCQQCGGGGAADAADCKSCCNCAAEAMGFRDDYHGENALFAEPTGVALAFENEASGGNSKTAISRNEVVYVADSMNNAIRRLVLGPGKLHAEVSTVAGGQRYAVSTEGYAQIAKSGQWGQGLGSAGCADGTGSDAMFNKPRDVAVLKREKKHVLYVADSGNNRVARVEVNFKVASTLGPTVQVPILAIQDGQTKLGTGAARTVAPGTEFQWDDQEQQWIDPSLSTDSASSVCPLKQKLTAPSTVEMVLGGSYHIVNVAFEWGPNGGPKEYQLSISPNGQDWETAVTKYDAPNKIVEQASFPMAAQKIPAQFVRLSVSSLHSDSLVVESMRIMGVMVDNSVTVQDILKVKNSANSEKSCADLGWRPSVNNTNELVSQGVCGSSKVGPDGTCLSFQRHNEADNNLTETDSSMTWLEADQHCQSLGARLCRIEEIEASVPEAADCDTDGQRVWSSTQCGCGGVLTQAGRVDSEDPMRNEPRVCSPITEQLSVQCCADGPPAPEEAPLEEPTEEVESIADDMDTSSSDTNTTLLGPVSRKLLQALSSSSDADTMTAASLPALQRMRFTNGNGTALADQECSFPFIYNGIAYNNCTTEGDENAGPNGWCPVADDSTEHKKQNGILSVSEDTKRGHCAAPDYVPPKCVVSPWFGWEMCTTVCGGGTRTRHRQIIHNTGSASLCGETTQVSPCNMHECGFVETIAGGETDRTGQIGFGFADSPYNPKNVVKTTSAIGPDLAFNPWSIAVTEQGNSDVVYTTGEPRSRADHVNLIRQIEVSPFTAAEKGGAGAPSNCANVENVEKPEDLPRSIAQCRLLSSGLVAEQIGNGIPSEGAVSLALTPNREVYSSLNNHQIGHIELQLNVACAPWMTEQLQLWELPTDSPAESSAPATLSLKHSQFSEPTVWKFQATRKVGSLSSLGIDESQADDPNGGIRTYSKNQMCSTLQQGDKPQVTNCCFSKEIKGFAPPEKCPTPVSPDCAKARKVRIMDYEYRNLVLQDSSWA